MRAWLARVAGLFRGRSRDADLQQEIETHLALMAEELQRRGLTREEATVEARRAFGGLQRTRVAYREQLGFPIVDAFVQDVRFAVRMLTRERGFAITSILVLGVGLGVNNMMFTLIYGITMRGLPIPERDRVLFVSVTDQRFPDRPLTYPEFSELRDQARGFEGLAAYVSMPVAVSDEGRAADRFDGTYLTRERVSAGTNRAACSAARSSDADDRPGADPVAILGADGLARALRERPVHSRPHDPRRRQADHGHRRHAGPVAAFRRPPKSGCRSRGCLASIARGHRLGSFACLGAWRPTSRWPRRRAEIETLFAAIVSRNPSDDRPNARVGPINERFFFSPTQPEWLAFSTAGILIALVCCANAANLMLATTGRRTSRDCRPNVARRQPEADHRAGARREPCHRECRRRNRDGGLDCRECVSSAARSRKGPCRTGCTTPSIRACSLHSWRCRSSPCSSSGSCRPIYASKTDPNRALKDGGRTATHSSRRLATVFLAAELAIAIVLAMQFAISWRGGVTLPSDAAVETTAVLTAAVTLPSAKYATAEQRSAFTQQLLERLPAVGGVTAASAATSVPYGGVVPQRLDVEGAAPASPEQAATVSTVAVDTGYFAVFSLPLRLGRDFSADDGAAGP